MASLTRPVGLVARAREDITEAVGFFTRVPVGWLGPTGAAAESFQFTRFAWAAPVAGAVVGLMALAAGGIADLLSLPPLVEAVAAIATTAFATGALHEDGFADLADGSGGGASREDKLRIMRDSRLGVYGVVALALALVLRVGMLTALFGLGFGGAACALVLSASSARLTALMPLALLEPARRDGAGASAGALDPAALVAPGAVVAIIAVITGAASLGVIRALFAVVVAIAASWCLVVLAKRQIGGQTGDVAGAAALVGELAGLVGLLMGGRGA